MRFPCDLCKTDKHWGTEEVFYNYPGFRTYEQDCMGCGTLKIRKVPINEGHRLLISQEDE